MKWLTNTRIGGILFLALSLAYGYGATQIQLDFFSRQETFNARSMPQFIAVCGIICSLLMIVLPSGRTDWSALVRLDWVRPLALVLLMWGYAASFELLGFPLATLLFLNLAFLTLGERRPLRMLVVSVPLVLGFWLLMDVLGIYLSPGAFFEELMAAAA